MRITIVRQYVNVMFYRRSNCGWPGYEEEMVIRRDERGCRGEVEMSGGGVFRE